MKQQWRAYSDKFFQLSSREKSLVLLTGIVTIFFLMSYFFIDDKSTQIVTYDKKNGAIQSSIKKLEFTIQEYQSALEKDFDEDIIKQIEQLEAKLDKFDSQLLRLTSDLISPIEMREALLELLTLESGVSLLSFELIGAQPLLQQNVAQSNTDIIKHSPTTEQRGINLYKHGMKIKLAGQYFQLRNYLRQLEQLPWKFFWQDFQFEVIEYPHSEVEIIIYSLGFEQGFIGV
ncbi:MAG: hypothetical protein V5789_03775 [Colwellia sp.]